MCVLCLPRKSFITQQCAVGGGTEQEVNGSLKVHSIFYYSSFIMEDIGSTFIVYSLIFRCGKNGWECEMIISQKLPFPRQ